MREKLMTLRCERLSQKLMVFFAMFLFAVLVFLFSSNFAFANDTGEGIGIGFETEDFDPLIWMCDHRKVIDDSVEQGRVDGDEVYSEKIELCELAVESCYTACFQGAASWCYSFNGGPEECIQFSYPLDCLTFCQGYTIKWDCPILKGFELIERLENYAFEGEKIEWLVLVMDKNKIEEVKDVVVTVGDSEGHGEPGCFGIPQENACEVYTLDQCLAIQGCNVVCDVFVDVNGVCGGDSPCYAVIQDAINAASPGDVICVGPGTYNENLLIGKGIALHGKSFPTIIGAHTITSSDVEINGFTLNIGGSGTAITLDSSSSLIDNIGITNNIFDMTTSPSIGVYLGGSNPNNKVSDITMSHNTFNGPTDQINNPWKIGGQFGSPLSTEVEGVDFECNTVNKGSIPINLHHADITDIFVNQNVFKDTDGVLYVWDDTGESPTGILSGFVFTNNDVDSSNSYGIGIDTAIPPVFTDANFGTGNRVNNNNFVNIPGKYGFKSVSILSTGLTFVLDAEDNWWGDLDPSDDIDGNVDTTPFEESELVLPECQPHMPPVCEGEPVSCGIIDNHLKCSETAGCVWASIGGQLEIEAECVRLNGYAAPGERIDDSCDARILEEELTQFDDQTMAFYECTFTVESPESMYGENAVSVGAVDSAGDIFFTDETEFWFFNPIIALNINGVIDFGIIRPGTISYSDTILVENDADLGSGVLLDMFISGTDFYDPSSSGARCVITNRLKLGDNSVASGLASAGNDCKIGFGDTDDHICYFASNGAYSTQTDPRKDAEGYVPIVYGTTFDTDFYNDAEVMQPTGPSPPGYQPGNILSPGAEIAVTFKLGLPEPCVGDFTDGDLFFWGEAI